MSKFELAPEIVSDIEAKVRSKLGEKLKTYRILREEVMQFLEEEATLLKYPIPDDELCAFVCKKEDRIFVYINTHIPKEKQVFAAAHELYHLWYDQDKLNQSELLHDQTIENQTEDIGELKANLFAAILLVPTEVLSNELISKNLKKGQIRLEDIVRLMSLFYVPYKTIVRRLFEINYIDENELDAFMKVPDRDPQNGVLLIRKRLQIDDSSQERTNDIFFEGLVENAIRAYEEGKIRPNRLRYLLSLVKLSPEALGIHLEQSDVSPDIWDEVMGDYDGDD